MKKYLTEFIGTMFLVLTVGLMVTHGSPSDRLFGGLAIGCSLMIMVYMGGHISGGHYNPAVTLAVCLRGKMLVKDFAPYIIAQLLGALAASGLVYLVTTKTFAPAPTEGNTWQSALVIEFLYTFALALVVLNAATSDKTAGNSFYGLAIGFTVVVAAFAGGPISGGAFNPAVGTGPILMKTIIDGVEKSGLASNLWIYWVGPLAGGALAAGVFKIQHAPD